MARNPQKFRVFVQEKNEKLGIPLNEVRPLTSEGVKLRALELLGMTPHPKYFNRIKRFTQPHRMPVGQREWICEVVRP